MKRNSRTATQQHGFTIVQMMVTLGIIAIVSTFGVLGIKTARAEFRLQNSARLFASYIEKARADSIRRHASTGEESSIETFGTGGDTSYAVTMDYGSGVETRTFQLDAGLEFGTAGLKVTFDWRGRLTEPCPITKACVFQIHSIYLDRNIPVDVSGSGDITVDEQHFPDQLIPPVETSQVTGDVYVEPPPPPAGEDPPAEDPGGETPPAEPTPTPTPNGNGNDNGNGNGNGDAPGDPTDEPPPAEEPPVGEDPAATPTPTPIPQCVSAISPSTLMLSQSDPNSQSGTATFTMSNATGTRIISASQIGNGNSLVIGLSLLRIDGSGSSVISVTTKNGAGNRGVFIVQILTDPACGSSPHLTVSVSN